MIQRKQGRFAVNKRLRSLGIKSMSAYKRYNQMEGNLMIKWALLLINDIFIEFNIKLLYLL